MDKNKRKCDDCDWLGDNSAVLSAPNPFYPQDTITGCPKCFSINSIDTLCDEDGCEAVASCGWPSPDGYRFTCWKHWTNSPYRWIN